MRILYLPGRYAFCYYYRGYLPGVYSEQMVVSDFIKSNGASTNSDTVAEMAIKADVVVMQRPNEKNSLSLAMSIKRAGKKLIFENDDTYLAGKGIPLERLENDDQRKIATDMSQIVKDVLKISDGVIASTETLAKEYAEINPNVVVLKNCIDPLDDFPCKKNNTGKFRLGFIGSVTTNDDYLHIKDQIKRLDERGDITIVVLGVKYKDGTHLSFMQMDYDFWSSLKNVEWQSYVPVTEFMMTVANLALDLAVIPRKDNYFNRCKSNLKFLEMSLLNIPVIAQGFADGTSPYQGVDSSFMSIVVDDNSWYDRVIEIKENYAIYSDLAKKAHDYVLENYNIKNCAVDWTRAINKLINK